LTTVAAAGSSVAMKTLYRSMFAVLSVAALVLDAVMALPPFFFEFTSTCGLDAIHPGAPGRSASVWLTYRATEHADPTDVN